MMAARVTLAMEKVSEVIKSKSCRVAQWSHLAPWCRILLLLVAGMPLAGRAEPPAFPGATASYKAWVAARLPGNPEGLAIDRDGTMYAGLWQSGTVVKLDGRGGYRTVAVIPSEALGRQGSA